MDDEDKGTGKEAVARAIQRKVTAPGCRVRRTIGRLAPMSSGKRSLRSTEETETHYMGSVTPYQRS